MALSNEEEAAVEAAVVAVRAHARQSGARTRPSRSAADVLNERLDLDWSIPGRGFQLLREVHRRVNDKPEPSGGSPDLPRAAGCKYEESTFNARRRLSRARA